MRRNIVQNAVPAFLLSLVLLAPAALCKVPIAEIGKNKIKLEVAQTKAEIEHGLMQRQSMPEDQGMIFLFRPTQNVRFWMYNCLMSLDMIFIKEGKIVQIAHDVPPYKSKDREKAPLYPTDGQVAVSEVLEVNAGYCARHGVKIGDSISFNLPGAAASANVDDKAKEKTPATTP